MHSGDRLLEFVARDMTLAALREQVITLVEILLKQYDPAEFQCSLRSANFIVFHRFSAARKHNHERKWEQKKSVQIITMAASCMD